VGAAARILSAEREALPHGPWHVRAFGLDTAEPTTVVMAGERAVCVITSPRSESVGGAIARLPDILRDTGDHAAELRALEVKIEALTDERDDLKDDVETLKDELRCAEEGRKAAQAEADRLFGQLADLRSKL
jgi:hypothetical protein